MSDLPPGGGGPGPSPLIRAKEIFLAIREMPLPQRDEDLERLCAGDALLRGMVEGLLAGDRAPLPFESLADDIVAARGMLTGGTEGNREGARAAAGESQLGSRIGRYRVLEKIGEGGFGVVYMAEQEEPVRRKVALKVIKLGMDTRQVVARFEAERQALALMDHPGIAKVHDAGATPSGRPFFVMELCQGKSITEYCDANRLPLRDRLALFVQVCQAVQHAHQKGLIHRDIKPSNILVSTIDGSPVAKVIDFGIAKATEARLTEKTFFTENRQLIGTPEYMSPEQAEGSQDIDTRSDVYSLGVLLYELLTGSTPFSSHELRSAAYAEIQRIIREVDPPRPSTRLSQATDTIASIAANRRTEPRRLGTIIRGELDWVVMKALEKARARRYATASDLAGDIERYLGNEPVSARPATALYRWGKFARRNKALVAGTGAVMLTLVAGLGTTTAMYLRADEARAAEAMERRRAQTKSETTEAINAFLTQDLLAAPNPWEGGGRDVTVSQTLNKAAAKVRERFAGKPEVEASVRAALGESYRSLGLFREAQPHYDRALELLSGLDTEAELAEALRMRAANMQSMGQFKEAEPVCRDALARNTKLFGADSVAVADTLDGLADIQIGLSLYAEAEKSLREAIRIRAGLPAEVAKQRGGDVAMARITNSLGSSLHYQGKYEEGERQKLKALDMFKAATGDRSPQVAQVLSDLGSVYFEMEKFDESERYFRLSLPLLVELLGPEHAIVLVNRRSLANTLSFQGRDSDAEPIFKEVMEISERTLGATHPDTLAAVNSFATMMLRTKRFAEAQPLLASLLERSTRSVGEKHAETLKYAVNLGWCEKYLKNPADAERHFRMAVDGFESTLGPTHPSTITAKDGFAQFLAGEKRWLESAKYDQQVIDGSAAAGEPEDLDTARILGRMGLNLMRGGDYQSARSPLTRSLDLCRSGFKPGDWRTGTAEWRLGDCLSNLGQHSEGEQLLLAGVKHLREDKETPPDNLEAGLQRLLEHYQRTGQTEKAGDIAKDLPPPAAPAK